MWVCCDKRREYIVKLQSSFTNAEINFENLVEFGQMSNSTGEHGLKGTILIHL